MKECRSYGGRLEVEPHGLQLELVTITQSNNSNTLAFTIEWCKNQEAPISIGRISGEAKWDKYFFYWESLDKSEKYKMYTEMKIFNYSENMKDESCFITGVIKWYNPLSDKEVVYYFQTALISSKFNQWLSSTLLM